MLGREYFLVRFGRGARLDWEPMSPMRSLPLRPGEERWKGGRRRSGQGVVWMETVAKFESRPDLRMGIREDRDGGVRGVFVTVQDGEVIFDFGLFVGNIVLMLMLMVMG